MDLFDDQAMKVLQDLAETQTNRKKSRTKEDLAAITLRIQSVGQYILYRLRTLG